MAKSVDAQDLKSCGNLSRAGSSPARGTIKLYYAGVAQLVERQPSKLNVASSTLVSRSILFIMINLYGDRSSVGRAPVCGTGCRGFKSRRSPHKYEPLAQSVEHLTFNQGVTGSIPVWLTILIKKKIMMCTCSSVG